MYFRTHNRGFPYFFHGIARLHFRRIHAASPRSKRIWSGNEMDLTVGVSRKIKTWP